MHLATSLQSLHPILPFSGHSASSNPKKRVPSPSISARKWENCRNKGNHDQIKGKLVDENMIVLRMRIQDMKKEEQQDYEPTSDKWTDWERKWCKNYESDVLEVVGLLQVLLMNTRPSLALGAVALLIFSVLTSLGPIVYYLLDFVSGFQIGLCT